MDNNILDTLRETIEECEHFGVTDDHKVITAFKFLLCFKTSEKSYNNWTERFNMLNETPHPDNLQDNPSHSPDCVGVNAVHVKSDIEDTKTLEDINLYDISADEKTIEIGQIGDDIEIEVFDYKSDRECYEVICKEAWGSLVDFCQQVVDANKQLNNKD